MANVKSAEKRNRQNKKRNAQNKMAKSSMKTAMKAFKDAVASGSKDSNAFKNAQKVVAQTARKGVIHKKTAARYISRMASSVNKSASK